MKVKVCGITTYEDAALALDAGADALGFNFYPRSPRYIRPADARSILRRLPPLAVPVGLFVNVADPEEVVGTARQSGVRVLQLHGDEAPEYCAKLAEWPVIKAVRVGLDGLPAGLDAYRVQALLLDAKDDVLFGGTGKRFDWSLVRGIRSGIPVILAGGLRPDNVRDAIRAVRPYAVDVCSGVESAPGRKDPEKLRQFMDEVRHGDSEIRRS